MAFKVVVFESAKLEKDKLQISMLVCLFVCMCACVGDGPMVIMMKSSKGNISTDLMWL